MNTEKVLSKTRFMAGLQCPLQLWLRVNEKNAPELQVDDVSRARMESGNRVGEIARGDFPGGVLIEGEHYEYENKRDYGRTDSLIEGRFQILSGVERELSVNLFALH